MTSLFNFRYLSMLAIIFASVTALWLLYEVIKNYENINKDYNKANKFFLEKQYLKSYKLYKAVFEEDPKNYFALEARHER